MNQSDFRITLDRIVNDYGSDILKDEKRVVGMFSDYCPEGQAAKNKLRIAYEFNLFGLLTKTPPNTAGVSIAYNKAIEILKEKAFIDSSVAASIVCDIAAVLKLEYSLPTQGAPDVKPSGTISIDKPEANADKRESYFDYSSGLKTGRRKVTAPVWVAGSGVGYSTYNNSIMLYVYDNLDSLRKTELTLSYKLAHPLKSLHMSYEISNKYRRAIKWQKAKMYYNIYSAYVLDGAKYRLSAIKYKRYNEKYIKKLERKFWS